MNIRQCYRCDKLFQFRGKDICPDCVTAMDNMFTSVRDYLFDHREASVEEVLENTGAERDDVIEWLREGRLIASQHKEKLLQCESCGQAIASGRYCVDCNAEMVNKLESTASLLKQNQQTQGAQASRMHTVKK